jgi:hypothetical protein
MPMLPLLVCQSKMEFISTIIFFYFLAYGEIWKDGMLIAQIMRNNVKT